MTPTHDTVESLLQRMVRIDTVNGNISRRTHAELPLAEEVERSAKSYGFETRRLPIEGACHNLLVTHRVPGKRDDELPWLMFESHMDTVTVEGMTIPPFEATIEGGRLWGRGSCDTKGTGAAMLFALRRYAALPAAERPNHIAVAFVIDEEIGMTGVRALARRHWPTLGFTPAGVIVGEPTMLRPIVAHNGATRWRIATRGVAAHSSNPARGRSAISAMVKVIQAFESRYIPSVTASHPLTGKAQCSLNTIRGGSQVNVIPAECEAWVDRRVSPVENTADILPAVEKILDELRKADPSLEVTQDSAAHFPPLTTRHNERLAAKVQAALTRLKLPTQVCGEPYATDAGDLDVMGIPAVVIGPGSILQAHTKDEFIELDQLRLGVDAYHEMMRVSQA